jgi:hypothetical protein
MTLARNSMSHDRSQYCILRHLNNRQEHETYRYEIAGMFGHFCTLELVWYTASHSLPLAHPRKVQRHRPRIFTKVGIDSPRSLLLLPCISR